MRGTSERAALGYSSKSRLIILNISLVVDRRLLLHGQWGWGIRSGSESEGERINKNYLPFNNNKHIY